MNFFDKKFLPLWAMGLSAFIFLIPFDAMVMNFFAAKIFDMKLPFWVSLWKEVYFLDILFLSGGLFVLWQWKKNILKLDEIDIAILLFSGLSLIIGFFVLTLHPTESVKGVQFFYGVRYDLFPLWIFAIVRRIPFSGIQKEKIFTAFFVSAIFVLLFGLVQKNFPHIMLFFGYGEIASVYAPGGVLPYCHQISHTELCRTQSTLSGPNQLASFCLVAFPLFFWRFFFQDHKKISHTLFWAFFTGLALLLLFWAYSRASWIGIVAAGATFLFLFFHENLKSESQISHFFIEHKKKFIIGIAGIFVFLSLFAVSSDSFREKVLERPSSSQGHYERSVNAAQFVLEYPAGVGLGKAGPASARFHEFIPENWYLQIFIETGIFGGILYLFLYFFLGKALWTTKNFYGKPLFFGFFAICFMCLLLHPWESAAVAYAFFILAGLATSHNQ